MSAGAVLLPRSAREAIVTEALERRPDECCGILIGHGRAVAEVLPAANADPRPARHFAIAPADLLEAERSARGRGADVIGFYHSHPRGAPVPSAADVAGGTRWPGYIHLILGLGEGGDTPELRAFAGGEGGWDEIPVRGSYR